MTRSQPSPHPFTLTYVTYSRMELLPTRCLLRGERAVSPALVKTLAPSQQTYHRQRQTPDNTTHLHDDGFAEHFQRRPAPGKLQILCQPNVTATRCVTTVRWSSVCFESRCTLLCIYILHIIISIFSITDILRSVQTVTHNHAIGEAASMHRSVSFTR